VKIAPLLICSSLFAAPVPSAFEPNRGQAEAGVQYLARISNCTLGLRTDGAVIRDGKGSTIRMLLEYANTSAAAPEERQPGSVSYFHGSDRKRWITGLPRFGRVRYREVYRGIDLVYYTTPDGFEYDFALAPGADPRAISLRFTGASRLEISKAGDLVIHSAGGDLHQGRPHVFQDGREIRASYRLHGPDRISLQIAYYDRNRRLIIDPSITFSTMLGGSGRDVALAVATDAKGAIYIAGSTDSIDFPGAISPSGPVNRPITLAHPQAFVAKLNPDGSSLEFATYLGGNDSDVATGVGVDAAGNVYVAGATGSFDFPTTTGAYLTKKTGFQNPFVAKLDPAGRQLLYGTFIGPTGSGLGVSITAALGPYLKVDPAGYVYLAGTTFDIGPAPTPGAFQFARKGRSDGYFLKLNPSGSAMVYASYLGGSQTNIINGLDVDSSGEAYVIGTTTSSDFPLVHAYQSAIGINGGSPFVARISSDGAALIYSTLFGGVSQYFMGAQFITADGAGGAFLAGNFPASNLPLVNPIWPDAALGGAYLARLDSTGQSVLLGTAIGSKSGVAMLGALARSSDNQLFLYLSSVPTDLAGSGSILPAAPPAYGGIPNLICLDAQSYKINYVTGLPVGGPWSGLVAAAPNREAIVAGTLNGPVPTTTGAFQTVYNSTYSGSNVFAYRVSSLNPTPTLDNVSPELSSTQPSSLYLFGSGFVSDSSVLVDGRRHVETAESPTRISVPLSNGELSAGQTISLQVVSPDPGGGATTTRAFTLLNPTPVIFSLIPNRIAAGTGDTVVMIRGMGLAGNSVGKWNGSDRPVRLVAPSTLEMTLSAVDVAQASENTVTVINPTPGGGQASAILLVSDVSNGNPLPTLSAIPPTVPLNGSTLFVQGLGFVSGLTVRWNGSDRPTEFVSANALRVTLTSDDTAQPGTAVVTVVNPPPGGGVSAVAAFIYVPVEAMDLAWEPARGRLFASTRTTDPAYPNSILRIEPTTGAIEAAIPTAGSPGLLAISAGGEYLYTALNSQFAVQRVDLGSNTLATPFRVDFNLSKPNFEITALQVQPSNPDTIVVARSNNGGLVILDAGAPRPNDSIATQLELNGIFSSITQMAVTDSAIYIPSPMFFSAPNAFPAAEPCYDRLSVDSYGLRRFDRICDGALDSVPEILRGRGLTAFVQNGQYSIVQFPAAGMNPPPLRIRVNSIRRRVYALSAGSSLSTSQLTIYDQDTFAVLSSIIVPPAGPMVLWGDDGVAIGSFGQLIMFHDR
jgi:hypothetical protein